jgi:Bacterial regulatory proteins, lacI family
VPGKLADIARQARASEATVSRVLNGNPGVPIAGFLIFQRSFLRGNGLGGAIKG